MEGSVVGVAGCVVQVDVHGKWVVFWVAEMYSVVAILSMADMACLNSLYAETLECMTSAGFVWYIGVEVTL